MDVLERVRELGADAAPFDDAHVDAARRALMREIAQGEQRVGAERTRWRWIGGSALVSGVAAVAVVVGMVTGPLGASPAAAAVLDAAADTTLRTVALSPAPGQYIRIAEVYEQSFHGFVPTEGTELDIDYTLRSTRVLYVPADREGDWIDDRSTPAEVEVTRASEDVDAEIVDRIAEEMGVKTGAGGFAQIEAHPGGRIFGGDGADTHDYRENSMERYYDEMPRDPQRLLDWIAAYQQEAGVAPPRLVDLIGFNLAPADLRAAIFRALALEQSASVLSVDGDITTIAYRPSGEGTAREVIAVDTSVGLIVGFGNEGSDNVLGRITVSIVDSAPEGVRFDG